MPTGGELVIQTANVELDETFAATHPKMVPGPAVLLAVTDTGKGMSEEVQRHVFEPFYTTKEKCRGTGLGLATVYGIVQQSQGCISVYSEPDKGSTFKIYFPRLPAGETEKAPSRLSTPDSLGTETILVVEDQDSVRTLAVLALKSSGYVVLEAANGQQALRLAESCAGPIHAMVTDVVMPGMSGPELASRMRDVRPETRVIFTSGYTDDVVVTRGVLTRGVEYLSKPYSLGVLLATVRRVLGPRS
jgi:CheY-like chemotaxis protein